MNTSGDVLGFAHDAEGNGGRLCIAMLEALSDQMTAEGITGNPMELQRRACQVFAGTRQCPLLGTCPRSPEPGQKTIWQQPIQLKFI